MTLQPTLENPFIGVFVGRFQIFHMGHLHVVEQALQRHRYLLIIIGSANEPRTIANPFSYDERKTMISACLSAEDQRRVFFRPSEDTIYNDEMWINATHVAAASVIDELHTRNIATPPQPFTLCGSRKDTATSFYLNMFPSWDSLDIDNHKNLSATPLRQAYFSNIVDQWLADCDGHLAGDRPKDGFVPTPVKQFLETFRETEDYKTVRTEYEKNVQYRSQFVDVPYPVIFQTVDAMVVMSGHILLVRRKSAPGMGLWALPGGFLKPNELLLDGTLRELYEETTLDVKEDVLRGSIVIAKVFDAVGRSSRGRTITQATLFALKRPGPAARRADAGRRVRKIRLPAIRASDDAADAKWWPIAEIRRTVMFEDHFSIIQNLTGYLG